MKYIDDYIKKQACNLSDALHRNLNDNFKSVSFSIDKNGEIQVKFVLSKLTEDDESFIEDIMGEYEAVQDSNIVKMPQIVREGDDDGSLDILVYLQA